MIAWVKASPNRFVTFGGDVIEGKTVDSPHFNPAGLRSPLVDRIINISLMAETPAQRDAALMALDRVLRWERIMVPTWFTGEDWVAYWDIFRHPAEFPQYSNGVLDWWWFDQARAEDLRAAGALR